MSPGELLYREDRMRRSIFVLLSIFIEIPKIARVAKRDGSSLGGLQARSDLGDDGLVSGQVFRVAA